MPDLSDDQHEFAWGVQTKPERQYILEITRCPQKYATYYWRDLPASIRRKVGDYFRDGTAPGYRV